MLGGDIGGTNTRLALVEVEGTDVKTLREETYPSRAFPSLQAIGRQFLAAHAGDMASEHACFGIAGPVRDGRSRATNLPWTVAAEALAGELEVKGVSLINDLEARGECLRHRRLGRPGFVCTECGRGKRHR